MAGLYLHIPFCRHACSYCDFYFTTQRQLIADFCKSLIEEIAFSASKWPNLEPIKTIYFGGGTPSLLSASQVEEILNALDIHFDISNVEEITFELNPENANKDYLNDLKKLGINRLSMGIQTFDPNLLRLMHRSHRKEDALKSFENIASTGFDSYSVDIIFANPGQTEELLQRDLDIFTSFAPPHISAYSLTMEPNTRFDKMLKKNKIQIPSDDTASIHFDMVSNHLKANGYEQYEVSNFAKNGAYSRHNSNYWAHIDYLGFGPAAHSFIKQNEGPNLRWSNIADLTTYLQDNGVTEQEIEILDLFTLAEENIMLSLRTSRGLDEKKLNELYQYYFNQQQKELIHKYHSEEYIEIKKPFIRLTTKGLRLVDKITLDILSAQSSES